MLKVPSEIVLPYPMAEAQRADKVQNFAERHWAESGPGKSATWWMCPAMWTVAIPKVSG